MFDIGWSELILIGTVALIVVGPKDLPDMFRQLGRFTSKARAMARDFSNAMEDAAKESGVHDVANDLKKVTSARSLGLDAVRNAATKFEGWDPMRATRTASDQAKIADEAVRHSAASVTATPPVAETLRPVPASKPARPRPEPVRRRRVEGSAPIRKAVPRKPLPRKPK